MRREAVWGWGPDVVLCSASQLHPHAGFQNRQPPPHHHHHHHHRTNASRHAAIRSDLAECGQHTVAAFVSILWNPWHDVKQLPQVVGDTGIPLRQVQPLFQ